ncbi:MAG: methyltransferase [Nocardioides sp.]
MPEQTDEPDYLRLNRANWDDRAVAHAEHGGYDLGVFVDDPDHLSDVVAFDRPRLGDLTGLRGVHLQCHLGTDTLSLARLGAEMSGLDLSGRSLEYAARLAADTGTAIDYVLCDVYGAVEALGGPGGFDLVYTGIGALCWLPDIDRWAGVVAGLLRPGGRLFLREGHPMLWALDDPRDDGVLAVEYPYFELPDPTEWDDDVTYVDVGDHRIEHGRTQLWNHGLAEILTALMRHGMTLTAIEEHESAPWAFLGDQCEAHPDHPGEFRLRERSWRIAATYTLQAVKTG